METIKGSAGKRILMLLENNCYPNDIRVEREARSLVAFGYRVHVIAPRGKRQPWRSVENGVRVYRFPRPREGESGLGYVWEYGVSMFWMFVLTAWVFVRGGFDVIHSHTPPDLLFLIAVCYWPFGKKFVFDHHDISPEMYVARFRGEGNPWIVRALLFFEGLSCRYATRIITVNESYKQLVVERHRIPAEKITVVRNGPSFDRLYLVEPDRDIAARKQTVLGYVGVMGFQDGIDSLIRALHKLKYELNRSDFYCILIGKGSSLEYLKHLTAELKLSDNVLFTGYVSHADLLKYLSTTDICIAPDPYNPFNDRSTMIKVMEYMTLAKPIVAYRLVEHQVTAQEAALYADVNDELDLARQIEMLMNDPVRRLQMGDRGRRRVEHALAWPHQERHLLEAYEAVFASSGRAFRHSQPKREFSLKHQSSSSTAKTARDEDRLAPASDVPRARFAFSGRLAAVLLRYLQEDAKNWKLSWKFRCYYQLRPWIPINYRHYLQRSRNAAMPVDGDWYHHHRFLNDWSLALEAELTENPELAVVHPWPDGYTHAAILSHDVESRDGLRQVDRLAQLEEQYGLRSAWFFVPARYRIDAGLLRDLQERGHEVGVHGYNHDGKLFFSRRRFERRAKSINQSARAWNAVGFRSPMLHRELDWMQSLMVDYDSSCFDVDPFQTMPGGVGGLWPFIYGNFVELPNTLPQDHTLFVTLLQQSIEIWRRKYELVRRMRGLAMCIVHPDYVDSADRWERCRELLDHWLENEDAWKCLPSQAAQWWRLRDASRVQAGGVAGPAAERGRPVLLGDLFAC